MIEQVRFLDNGTITSVQGFQAGATFAGIKTYALDKFDLGIVYSTAPCTSAAVFTTNQVRSPTVTIGRERVEKGDVRAVIVNSGIANTVVGEPGFKDAIEMGDLAAGKLGLQPEEVAVLSTGIIGVELPMALLRVAVPNIELSEDGGDVYARAMMTTDTHPKQAAVAYDFGGRTVTFGAVAKGTGMIHPNMATMLAVFGTDAPVDKGFLQQAVKRSADLSFNMISVDGDSSTNDTFMVMANGVAGGPTITADSDEAGLFQEALTQLCVYLAKEMVRDGEGASKLFQVIVEGAETEEEARMAARTISSSSLVKTAVHGNDPNWGRVVAAAGRSGARLDESKLAMYVNDVCILEHGLPVPFFKDAVILQMKSPELTFRLSLNLGDGTATAWGCNLSEAYVTFNSAYTT
jgi:glutamate N-acetyltransferase/amino-acid N-acetyltransferase